jgi:hypothetical protein
MGFSHPSKDIHPEDDNCNVSRNVGKPSTFYEAYSRKLKLYINNTWWVMPGCGWRRRPPVMEGSYEYIE